MYSAETKVGGGSVLKSMADNNPIRVFRSSVLKNEYRAREAFDTQKASPSALYRYDGLYKVTKVGFLLPVKNGKKGEDVWEVPNNLSSTVPNRLYHFHLVRVKRGNDDLTNLLDGRTFINVCKSRGTMLPP